MNILKKFLTPKWQNKNPAIRKQALLELDKEIDKSIIENMAKSDEDTEIRQMAIKRINNIDLLKDIASSETNADNRDLAHKLLSQAIAGSNEINIDDQQRMALLLQMDNPRVLETVAREGKNFSLRLAALGKLNKPSLFVDIAINDADAQMRSAALERVDDPKALDRVAKQTKNKDKVIHREAKAKLDAIIAKEEMPKRLRAEHERIVRALEDLGRRGDWAFDHQRFLRLQDEWTVLDGDREPNMVTRFDAAVEKFTQAYNDYSARNAEKLEHDRKWATIKQEKQKLVDEINALAAQVRASEFADANEIATYRDRVQDLSIRWEQGEALPTEHRGDIERQFRALVTEVNRYLRDIAEHSAMYAHIVSLAKNVAALANRPAGTLEGPIKEVEKALARAAKYLHVDKIKHEAAVIESQLGQLKAKVADKKHELKTLTDNITKLLGEQKQLIQDGLLNDALQVVKKIRQEAKHLAELDPHLAGKWQRRIRDALQETEKLNDWRKWANAPKKEELIKTVENLIGRHEDPHELARQIQKAREDWKMLGASEASKELWERFNDACNRAYEPCQQFFAQEAEERQRNQQLREAFVEKLETFVNTADWNTVNWKKVEHLIQNAHVEWNSFGPTDWKARQALGERFHEAVEKIRAQVHQEWAKNLAIKQKIVADASALVASDNTQEASLKVRELQKRWTTAGRVSQKDERRLWKEFRAACDAVFQKRTQKRNEAVEKIRESEHRLVDICESLERISQLQDAEFDQGLAGVRDLQEEWKQTSMTVEKLSTQIEKRFRDALKDIDEAKYIFKRRKQLLDLVTTQERGQKLETYIQAIAEGNSPKVEAIAAEWQSLPIAKTPYLQKIDKRLQQVLASADQPGEISRMRSQSEQEKRQLAVRYEILAEIDTPPNFTQDRVAYQMNRLATDIGKGVHIDPWQEFLVLEQEWFAAGMCSSETESLLEARRERALNVIGRMFADELANYL